MKLYSRPTSPYCVRVLASLALKGIRVELLGEPEGGYKSARFVAVNPLGKVPVLLLENGDTIAESLVIQEFIEDRFPDRSLRPTEPIRLAQMRLAGRVVEQHIDRVLLNVVMLIVNKSTDNNAIASADAALYEALGLFTQYWRPGPYALGSEPTMLDCQMLPVLTLLKLCSGVRGKDYIEDFPELVTYQEFLANHALLSPLAATFGQAMMLEINNR